MTNETSTPTELEIKNLKSRLKDFLKADSQKMREIARAKAQGKRNEKQYPEDAALVVLAAQERGELPQVEDHPHDRHTFAFCTLPTLS